MKVIQEYKAIAKGYNALKKDIQRLQYLKDHNDCLMAVLDNDHTYVQFFLPEDADEDLQELIGDIRLNSFDDYHYWSDGCILLFQFAGIKAEAC